MAVKTDKKKTIWQKLTTQKFQSYLYSDKKNKDFGSRLCTYGI